MIQTMTFETPSFPDQIKSRQVLFVPDTKSNVDVCPELTGPLFYIPGATRDIGTCLTRIVIRHRSMESRMKSLAGALMDCLIIPVQGRLDEWRRVTAVLDKDHAKDYKKYRSTIKKKADQAARYMFAKY